MSSLDYEQRTLAAVRDYLGNTLPDSEVKGLAPNGEEKHLLLLTMPQLVAGFGFTSRDLESTYSGLYGAFKREYAEHRNEWDNLDLAFVLCVPEGLSGLQAFGSSVETDAYFCRKYVVPMNGHVDTSLARLPFLPLFTERKMPVRPPSAQTFLQESGVPSVLARYLVKKGERSARSVVSECMGGSFRELQKPERSPGVGAQLVSTEAAPIRLKSISIEGFRAYRRKMEISFGDDLTILFGPNGFGKTSVFDAVDFAFTGEIGRLHTRTEGRFRRVAAHLDNKNGRSEVALTVGLKDGTHQLVRRVMERMNGKLDGTNLDRKATLEKLTGWRGPGADRVENIISLFRATHLFSQEHQELAREFQPECRLSSEVVSRLLAYEDYHATREKVSDICKIAAKEIRELDLEVEETTRQSEGESEELELLGRTLEDEAPNEDLSDLVEAIAKRIKAEGLEIGSVEPKAETVRSWRITLETRSSGLRRRSDALRACAGLLEELPRRRQELARANERQKNLDSRVALARKRTSEARTTLRKRRDVIDRLAGRMRYLVRRQEVLAWIENNKELHAKLQTEVTTTSEQLTLKAQDLDRISIEERSLATRLRGQEARRNSATRALVEVKSEIQRGQEIGEGINAWQTKMLRVKNISAEEEQLKKAVFEIWQSEERFRATLNAAVEEERRLTVQIETIEDRRGELSDLVGALVEYIEGGVCPTCGQDHGSQQALLERIAVQLGGEVATGERSSRDTVRTRINDLRSSIEQGEEGGQLAKQQLAKLGAERNVITLEIETFRGLMEQFGVPIGNDVDMARKEVAARCALLEKESGERTAEVARATEASETAGRGWGAITGSVRRMQEETGELKNRLEDATTRLARLVEDPRNQGNVGLDSPGETVREHGRTNEAEVTSTRKFLDDEGAALRSDEESLNADEADLASSQRESSALVSEIDKLGDRCQSIERMLSDANVELGESREAVLDRAQVAARKASVINGLIEDVASVELVIDAATTRAAYRRLQARLTERQSAIAELSSKRDAYAWWLGYFREVRAMVASEHDKAVSRFTREYGPRTSVIQRRLRSVYGFDDVEIRSQESNILVRVSRGDKLLRPTDYFSQSQQQTLLLGLFLTACVSQTWSGLAPVFLDDPIAHFDDLNIFAFLDLIDGLMNDNGAGKRQFVISTCDQKFLELAREKFAYRGESVKYYSFRGIGEDGPIMQAS